MTGKLPGDMTDTETFALDNYGDAPGPPPVADQFRSLVSKAYAANKKGAGYTADAATGAVDAFQKYRDENPLVKWGTGPAAGTLFGPAGKALQIASTAPVAPAAKPPPPQMPQPQQQGEKYTYPQQPFDWGQGATDVNALPNAPLRPKMGPGMGPDPYEGYGTDKGVLHAQQDYDSDIGGMQEKKGEEYTAKLAAMATHADLLHEHAEQQRKGAEAYQSAVQQEDKRQEDAAVKIQQATDDTAAMGIDPGRYYKDRNFGFWLTMSLGAVASGMLSAMQGQNGNPFLDQIRQTVNTDIAAQEKGIEQSKYRVKGMETAYERMRLQGADRITAQQKQYDLTLQALETEAQARLTKATIPAEKAGYEAALQAIQIDRQKNQIQTQEYWKNIRETRARAAASAAMAKHAAERQARLDADESALKKSQTVKNYAEAAKTGREGEKTDKEREKSARLYDVHTRFLDSKAVTDLAKSAPGSVTSKAGMGEHVPWQTDAREYNQKLDDYNSEVDTILGHWLKDEAGRVPVEEYRNQAERMELKHGMTDQEKAARQKSLKAWVTQRAKTSGVIAPDQDTSFGAGVPSFSKSKP